MNGALADFKSGDRVVMTLIDRPDNALRPRIATERCLREVLEKDANFKRRWRRGLCVRQRMGQGLLLPRVGTQVDLSLSPDAIFKLAKVEKYVRVQPTRSYIIYLPMDLSPLEVTGASGESRAARLDRLYRHNSSALLRDAQQVATVVEDDPLTPEPEVRGAALHQPLRDPTSAIRMRPLKAFNMAIAEVPAELATDFEEALHREGQTFEPLSELRIPGIGRRTAHGNGQPAAAAREGLVEKLSRLEVGDGSGVVIGFVDTGIDPHSPEFQGRPIAFTKISLDGVIEHAPAEETHAGRHGTKVAALALGAVSGVAPAAGIAMAVGIPNFEGSVKSILTSVEWLVRDANADIVNLSVETRMSIRFFQRLVDVLQMQDPVAVVAATGNFGQGCISTIAEFDQVISVGAVEANKKLARCTGHRRKDRLDDKSFRPHFVTLGTYENDGCCTSYATPRVSGLIAAAGLHTAKDVHTELAMLGEPLDVGERQHRGWTVYLPPRRFQPPAAIADAAVDRFE